MVGPEVGQVGRLLSDSAVFDYLGIIESACVSMRFGDPVGESFLRFQVVAEMPFAAQSADVSKVAKDFRQGLKFCDCA